MNCKYIFENKEYTFDELKVLIKSKYKEEFKKNGFSDYSSYIARVSLGIIKNPSSGEFNNSVVKDIVYHGSLSKFDKFIKEITKRTTSSDGIWFTDSKELAKEYSISEKIVHVGIEYEIRKKLKTENPSKSYKISSGLEADNYKEFIEKYGEDKIHQGVVIEIENLNIIYPSIVNIKKLKTIDGEGFNQVARDREVKIAINENKDGLIIQNTLDTITNNYDLRANTITVFEPEQIHILGSKQDIERFKEFLSDTQKTEDYFNEEIKKIQKESKTIDEKISKFESTQKIDNKNTSKALQNMQEKVKIIGDKLLSLGFEFINENEYQFSTSSYITFKSKLNSLEGIDVSINTFKSPDYLIKIKIAPLKNNFDLQKQGELPFNPIELKLALKENDFIQDIADNTFEGLTEEQINILRDNLENGELNLNCKI